MSRATLFVRFPDGSLRYGLYCGTTDMAWPALFTTPQEAWDDYGRSDGMPDDVERFPVTLATDYADGLWWEGTATRDAVCDGLDQWEQTETGRGGDGLPSWARYPEPSSGVSR